MDRPAGRRTVHSMDPRSLLAAVDHAAAWHDEQPWSPRCLGERLRHWDTERRTRLADARAAAAQAGPAAPTSGPASTGALAAITARRRDRDRHAPEGRIAQAATVLTAARPAQATGALLNAYDRLTRGWDRTDLWDLDRSLARRTGEQLLALAAETQTWPGALYPTLADWTAALHRHGTALTAYGDTDLVSDLSVAASGVTTRATAHAARRRLEDKLHADAGDAWRWIAEHHGSLWD